MTLWLFLLCTNFDLKKSYFFLKDTFLWKVTFIVFMWTSLIWILFANFVISIMNKGINVTSDVMFTTINIMDKNSNRYFVKTKWNNFENYGKLLCLIKIQLPSCRFKYYNVCSFTVYISVRFWTKMDNTWPQHCLRWRHHQYVK